MCLLRPGGVGWDYHHGTHRPTGQCDISQQKHHSQRKGGPVGEWAKECVRVEYKRTVNVLFITQSASFPQTHLACNLTGNLLLMSNLSSREICQQVAKLCE